MDKLELRRELHELFHDVVRLTPLNANFAQFKPSAAELASIKADIAEQTKGARVLPPYLGEMGHEVLGFLGFIEPWLRSGWKIIARRPELYPEGTAFCVPPLFALIDKLAKHYGSRSFGFHQRLLKEHKVGIRLERQDSDYKFRLTYNQAFRHKWLIIQQFQQILLAIFKEVLPSLTRKRISWDGYLPALRIGLDIIEYEGFNRAFPPSYQPYPFVKGAKMVGNHVGLQLRNQQPESRNSNVRAMLKAAQEAAGFLNLPLIIYGHPVGTILPQGFTHSYQLSQLAGLPLLTFELQALRNCSLMLSPVSGWADLMAWLQVPTLVEDNPGVEPNDIKLLISRQASFKPQVALIDFNRPLAEQLISLLANQDHIGLPARLQSIQAGQILPLGMQKSTSQGFGNWSYR